MISTVVSSAVVHTKRDRTRFVRDRQREAATRAHKAAKKTTAKEPTELTNLCLMLHLLAQKYVPRTPQTFRDFDALAHATRVLQQMGLNPEIAANMCSPTRSVETAAVLNSPEYRALQNRFVAALATIADMTEKNTPPGSPDYQSGVREGYRRASDIAILFLEDLHGGDTL